MTLVDARSGIFSFEIYHNLLFDYRLLIIQRRHVPTRLTHVAAHKALSDQKHLPQPKCRRRQTVFLWINNACSNFKGTG